jgi:hypothetical protein
VRPIPIPDECVPPGCKRFVIAPPDGDLTNDRIRPVEAVAGIVEREVRITMLVALEPGELARLGAMADDGTPAIWLTMITKQIPPFMVEIADGQG